MTTISQRCSDSFRTQCLGPFELFVVGWRLIFSEIFWFFKSRCRLWEIRQLKKRLDTEYMRLGREVRQQTSENRHSLDLKKPGLDLTLGQIDLLQEEVAYLKKAMQAERDIFVEKRRQKYLKNQAG